MPLVIPPTECKGCGACCYHLLVPVEEGSEVPEHLTEIGESRGLEMKQRKDGSCIALDCDTRLCTIYDHRPAVCREFGPEENAVCLDRVHARQKLVRDESAEHVERVLRVAAEFAVSRGLAPTMRTAFIKTAPFVHVFLQPTLVAPDIRAEVLDKSLYRMKLALTAEALLGKAEDA